MGQSCIEIFQVSDNPFTELSLGDDKKWPSFVFFCYFLQNKYNLCWQNKFNKWQQQKVNCNKISYVKQAQVFWDT